MFFTQLCRTHSNWLIGFVSLTVAITSCSRTATNLTNSPTSQISQVNIKPNQTQKWRLMTTDEQEQVWKYILNSPLGIAALNQLAIEGFISPGCPKTFYVNEKSAGFETLLQVKCPSKRGTSAALGYEEIRVIFSRFENNIENFQIKRVSSEKDTPITPLPN